MTNNTLSRLKTALAGRYTIERELGAGGMATVYLSHDVKHDRKVAVKVMRPEIAAALGPERFVREIKIAARLNHPHILALHDSGEADGFLFYVMPYVEGESLRDWLNREKQLPIDDVLRVTGEVARALSFAHSHGVVHRDIKPENILLSAGEAVVADFGIAKAIHEAGGERLTETGIAVGTPTYMSPEQAGGSEDIDGRSDVYSLACMTYEMLAGQPPFTGPTVESVVRQHVAVDPPDVTGIRPSVSRQTSAALSRAMAKVPADRYASAADFDAALASTDSVEVQPAARAARPVNRHVLVVAALTLIGLIAGTLWITKPWSSAARTERVLVLAFENLTDNSDLEALGLMMADWITQGIQQADFVEVVPPGPAMFSSAEELTTEGRLGEMNRMKSWADRVEATTVVSGSIFPKADSIQVVVRLVDVSTESILRVLLPVTVPLADYHGSLDTVRRNVLGALAQAVANVSGVELAGETASVAPSWEAYREYVDGMRLFWRVRFADALPHFVRAAELDSSYFAPRLFAAVSLFNQGFTARADSVIQELASKRTQFNRRERLALDQQEAILRGDWKSALAAQREQTVDLPRNTGEWFQLGFVAVQAGFPREAIDAFRHMDPDWSGFAGWLPYWTWLTRAQHMAGDFEGELASARLARAQYPDAAQFPIAELRAMAALGRGEEVISRVRADPISAGYVLVIALELRAHGDGVAGDALLEELVDGIDGEDLARRFRAWTLQYLGRLEEARSVFDGLSAENPNNTEALGRLGVIQAMLGESAGAQRVASTLENASQPYRFGEHTYWRAAVVLALGDVERGVALLHQAFDEGLQHGLDLHRAPEFEALYDHPRFRELLEPR